MNPGRRPSVPLSLLLVFTALIIFFAAGYGLMSLIYRWTGTPPDFWTHILSGLVGDYFVRGAGHHCQTFNSQVQPCQSELSDHAKSIAECHDPDRPGGLRCLRQSAGQYYP